ncbi:MAG: hypothetical protein RBS27_13720 [Giesbergeria sp.]|jgi:hypothetical protein|nr:hypothetical protein [Giesbergeria sp.]
MALPQHGDAKKARGSLESRFFTSSITVPVEKQVFAGEMTTPKKENPTWQLQKKLRQKQPLLPRPLPPPRSAPRMQLS